VQHDRDADGGERGQPDGEQQDRTAVGVEVHQRRLQRGRVEQRRQETQQRDVGGQPDLRHERHEGGGDPERDQHERSREAEPVGGAADGDHDDEQGGDGQHELHAPIQPGGRWGR
jgi:hypothetical protein